MASKIATKKAAPKSRAIPKPKARMHYTEPYIVDPVHPVTVNVIGIGGTGSQVLNSLARMHSALKALGHPGLFVRAIDPDKVTAANMGRQLFSPADLGEYKCTVLIGRINRFFATDWQGMPTSYGASSTIPAANITISCVDTGKARKDIKAALTAAAAKQRSGREQNQWGQAIRTPGIEPYDVPYYWMDYGNMMDRGQIVIGTLGKIAQPKKSQFACLDELPTIDHYHPDILIDNKNDDQGPSCSLAEALAKQDLFINTNLANMGLGLLWKMFRELRIQYHGLYLNLETMAVNPIKV